MGRYSLCKTGLEPVAHNKVKSSKESVFVRSTIAILGDGLGFSFEGGEQGWMGSGVLAGAYLSAFPSGRSVSSSDVSRFL